MEKITSIGGDVMGIAYADFDIRNIERDSIRQINTVKIDDKAPCKQRMSSFMEQLGNKYCYADGDMIIGFAYADTEATLEDKLAVYANGLG